MSNTVINITQAQLLGDWRIELRFDDGKVQVVDFKPFLSAARHPDIRAYLQPEAFARFRLEHGELIWGDYALCFPIMDLYNNDLMHHAHPGRLAA